MLVVTYSVVDGCHCSSCIASSVCLQHLCYPSAPGKFCWHLCSQQHCAEPPPQGPCLVLIPDASGPHSMCIVYVLNIYQHRCILRWPSMNIGPVTQRVLLRVAHKAEHWTYNSKPAGLAVQGVFLMHGSTEMLSSALVSKRHLVDVMCSQDTHCFTLNVHV